MVFGALWCASLLSPAAAQSTSSEGRDYALGPWQFNIAVQGGGLRQDARSDGGYPGSFGGSLGAGIRRGLSAQFTAMATKYTDTVYLDTQAMKTAADIATFLGGLQYEYRRPGSRLGVYLDGGAGALNVRNLSKPTVPCVYNPQTRSSECFDFAPGVIAGQQGVGYFGGGANISVGERWGIHLGFKALKPFDQATGPYWWYQPEVGLFYRTR